MVVNIPPELEEFVNAVVASGEFKTEGDVVAEGLRLLRQRSQQIQELRSELEPAIARLAAGQCREIDMEEIKSRGMARLAQSSGDE